MNFSESDSSLNHLRIGSTCKEDERITRSRIIDCFQVRYDPSLISGCALQIKFDIFCTGVMISEHILNFISDFCLSG